MPGATNPPGHTVTVIDPKTNHVTGTIDLGVALQPYGVTFGRSGRKAYVTNWMGRSVSVIDTRTERVRRRIILSPPSNPLQADHPNAIVTNPRRHEVYTANGNSDTVSIIDARRDRVIRTMHVGLVRGARPGAMPSGLAVSPDGKRLYVALGGENAIAVLDLVHRKRIGFIPTAWNPTDVDITRDGKKLVITTANAAGHRPTSLRRSLRRRRLLHRRPRVHHGAATRLSTKGGISVVRTPRKMKRLRHAHARPVLRNNRVRARRAAKPPALRAIRHVIYVIKENRTYDQVLGNLGKGDGDPGADLFGEDSAPNHRELARRFTLFDNFFADADVSADGLSWTVSAGVTDYIDKTWPITYSPGARRRHRARDFEHVDFAEQFLTEPLAFDRTIFRGAAALTRGYLWDNAYNHNVSFRDYGFYTKIPGDCGGARQHVGDHPPRRPPLRRPRRRALPRLQPRLLRPRGPRARVGARVRQLRGAVPRRPRRRTRCPRCRSCGSRTTTRTARRRARRSRRATSPTTTSRSAASSSASPRARSGPTPRSWSPRTTRRTAPTTSTRTARSRT